MPKTSSVRPTKLQYLDGQSIVDFLRYNPNKLYSEEDFDALVPGRKELTAITLAILCKCNVLVEKFDGRNSWYCLKNDVLILDNDTLERDILQFFRKNKTALISPLHLSKTFLSPLTRIVITLDELCNKGIIQEVPNGLYRVTEKYASIEPQLASFSDLLFGTPSKNKKLKKFKPIQII